MRTRSTSRKSPIENGILARLSTLRLLGLLGLIIIRSFGGPVI
jgi:hypothetical protein